MLWSFWKGKEPFSNCGNPEKLQAFSQPAKPALQCAVPVLMYAINLHNKILIAMPDERSAVLCRAQLGNL